MEKRQKTGKIKTFYTLQEPNCFRHTGSAPVNVKLVSYRLWSLNIRYLLVGRPNVETCRIKTAAFKTRIS